MTERGRATQPSAIRTFGLTSLENRSSWTRWSSTVPSGSRITWRTPARRNSLIVSAIVLGRTERAVALCGAPEVHRVAAAQDLGRIVEGTTAIVVDAREEQVGGVEPFERAAGLMCRRLDHLEPLRIPIRRHDIAHPAVRLASDAPQGCVLARAAPDRRTAGRRTAAAACAHIRTGRTDR